MARSDQPEIHFLILTLSSGESRLPGEEFSQAGKTGFHSHDKTNVELRRLERPTSGRDLRMTPPSLFEPNNLGIVRIFGDARFHAGGDLLALGFAPNGC